MYLSVGQVLEETTSLGLSGSDLNGNEPGNRYSGLSGTSFPETLSRKWAHLTNPTIAWPLAPWNYKQVLPDYHHMQGLCGVELMDVSIAETNNTVYGCRSWYYFNINLYSFNEAPVLWIWNPRKFWIGIICDYMYWMVDIGLYHVVRKTKNVILKELLLYPQNR